jgi:hypothetical protein
VNPDVSVSSHLASWEGITLEVLVQLLERCDPHLDMLTYSSVSVLTLNPVERNSPSSNLGVGNSSPSSSCTSTVMRCILALVIPGSLHTTLPTS